MSAIPISHRYLLGTACAALLVLASTTAWPQQPAAVPKKFQALYDELQTALNAFERDLPRAPERPLLRAAVLASTRCDANEEMLDAARRQEFNQELSALRNLGADAAVVEVCYPLLTDEYQEPRMALEHYTAVANEIRARGMKVMVRHTLLPVSKSRPGLQRYWLNLSRQRFEAQRYEEAKSVLYAMRPDYLTLQADRTAAPAGRRISPRDWGRLTQAAAAQLRGEVSGETLIGAGLGPSADSALLDALAAARDLDYIDLQIYPLWFQGQDQLQRLMQWPARVRAANARRRVIVSESWLRKLSRAESDQPIAEEQARAREVYDFWAPLDQRYLELLGRAARIQSIELLGVGRTHQLFTYLDFYDPTAFRMNDRGLIERLRRDFVGAVRGRPPNAVGRAFGAM